MIINIVKIKRMMPLKPENYTIVFIHFYAPEIFILPGKFMRMPILKCSKILWHLISAIYNFQHHFDPCCLVGR